jgi:hypothetical protein
MRRLSSWWLVFFLTILVHGLATGGRALAGEDTPSYVQLANGFASGDFSGAFNLNAVRWTKSVYIVLLALARASSPVHWMGVMVALNVVCSGIVAALLFDLACRASRSFIGPLFALLFYLASYEVFQWMRFVLTDLLFCATGFIVFYLAARRIIIEGEPFRPLLLTVTLLVALFSRPPGVLLVPLVIFVELVLVRRRVRPGVATAIIVVAAVAVLFVRTAAVHDPARWPLRFVKPKLVEFSAREKTGEVVYDRRETFRPRPRTPADHLLIVADRFVRFFQVTTSGFSRVHNLFNIVWFLPLYALALFGVIQGLRGADARRRSLVIALLMWIGLFALLYALTSLDFDWRSRTPLIPHLILLAVCGADALATRWFRGAAEPTR